MSGAEPADASSDAGHTWGEPRSDDVGDGGDGADIDAGATRSQTGTASLQMAVKILCEATEDAVMDTLEEVRLKARARLAALFAQSVAEGHQAYDPDPVVAGTGAFYDSALLAANLFPEDVVDEALAQTVEEGGVVDSSDSISDTPPEGRPAEDRSPGAAGPTLATTTSTCSVAPLSKKATAKAKNPQQLHPHDARQPQPVAVVQPVVVAKAPAPTVLKVQVTVPAEFQDVIATETYSNDPVLVVPKGGTNPNPLFRYPPVPAHVQFGGTPHPTAAATAAATGAGQEPARCPVRDKAFGTVSTDYLDGYYLDVTSSGVYSWEGGWEYGAPVRATAQGYGEQVGRSQRCAQGQSEPGRGYSLASWDNPPGYNSDWGPVLDYASGLLGYYIPVRSALSPLRAAALWQGQSARPPPSTLSPPLPCVQGRRRLRTRSWSSLAHAVYYMFVFQFGAARTLFCTVALPQNPLERASWVVRGRFGAGLVFGTPWFFVPFPRSAPVSLTPRRVVVRRTFASAAGGGPCGRSSGHPGRSGRFASGFGWFSLPLPQLVLARAGPFARSA